MLASESASDDMRSPVHIDQRGESLDEIVRMMILGVVELASPSSCPSPLRVT